jgi:hypothetical protein
MELVDYVRQTGNASPVLPDGKLYRYILAENGVFVYGKNQYFEALIPVLPSHVESQHVRGLEPLQSFFRIRKRLPFFYLSLIVNDARDHLPFEALYYIRDLPSVGMTVCFPTSAVTRSSCRPIGDWGYVPVEIHSHNMMDAFFSAQDNSDETGLRVYGVLGHVDRPIVDLHMRVSIYGHRMAIPYDLVFEDFKEVKNA